jgi:hypothetical protein
MHLQQQQRRQLPPPQMLLAWQLQAVADSPTLRQQQVPGLAAAAAMKQQVPAGPM